MNIPSLKTVIKVAAVTGALLVVAFLLLTPLSLQEAPVEKGPPDLPTPSEQVDSVTTALPSEEVPKAEPITRFPTMESPGQVVVDKEFAVQISLTEQLITPETQILQGKKTESGELTLALPQQQDWKIDVVISAPGFDFKNGANISSFTLPREGDSEPAVFYLRAKSFDGQRKMAKVFATLWHEGVFLAKIARELTVLRNAALATAETRQTPFQDPAEARGKPVLKGVTLYSEFQAPDLTVYVLENLDGSQPGRAEIIFNSPFFQPSQQFFSTPAGLAEWLGDQYAALARQMARNVQPVEASSRPQTKSAEQTLAFARGLGRELYSKLAPPPFKEVFWKLSDKLGERFKTIQIYTNNPILPWELLQPTRRRVNGEVEARDFLGMEFRVARWHVGEGVEQLERPPQFSFLREFIVIAPQYVGAQALASQQAEITALRSVAGFKTVEARFDRLQSVFGNLPEGIVHFAGHGAVKRNLQGAFEYSILLEDQELDLMTWRGLAQQRRGQNPLIFFNACEVAQSHRVVNFVDGWAPAMLEAGASGYIGGLWPVNDRGAAEFAIHFYNSLQQELQQGPANVADLLRATRKKFYTNGDPTFLAYVYYGDPNFRFVRDNNEK